MRIGELAKRAGVSVRALRYYEEQGLLASTRTAGGQRKYGEHAVRQVELIQQLYAAGLASRTISGLLPCVVSGEVTPELLDRLTAERDRIDGQLANLQQTRDRLDDIITTSAVARAVESRCAGVSPR
ncbi:MerR family transcriptional regulator [Amycolatopsis sp. YIM 10]|uniref:MerR family transcriptional regulator n=1 Tax=Amycolatopsis sp. YIM 10 TaxID=2653857 RepID=UPI0012907BC0|nr:MerR family transcriptional regulator [Amycolatopsis sp. YIM 10]QFU92996.1 Redox-sensitive transcriptional activator SoxR [Amycolatopsis sp. YIM 10]